MMHRNENHTIEGFVSARGTQLVDGNGRPVLLRGVGLGSWFLPEGYMWKMPAQADRPRRMEQLILDLVGRRRASEFWETYWDNFITEEDVKRIAAEGFNSLRLPLSARYLTGSDASSKLLEPRMARIDALIEWCTRHRVYIILDLHGAPGGQTGTNIDDSPDDQPDLFRFPENEERTIEIWRALAERYKDEEIIAGYDLLNEPLPGWFSEYNHRVLPLYRRITAAIRSLDVRHMIILEGVHWATDWSIFEEPFDDNLMLQFHKYWNNPDRESIAEYLQAREKWNLPIFMGEGGENNTDWYSGAFRMFEDLDISWNFWTWKKMSTGNSPASIRKPAGWDQIVRAAEDPATVGALGPEEAWAILREYARGVRFSECEYHPEVVGALFRRPPLRIPAIFYSYRDRGTGFDPGPATQTVQASPAGPEGKGGQPAAEPPIDFRRGDGMRFGYVAPGVQQGIPHFAHNGGEDWSDEEWMYVQLAPGAWARYDFLASHPAGLQAYTITLLLCGTAGSRVEVSIAGKSWDIVIPPEAAGCFQEYAIKASVSAGLQPVKVAPLSDAVQLQSLHVTIAE